MYHVKSKITPAEERIELALGDLTEVVRMALRLEKKLQARNSNLTEDCFAIIRKIKSTSDLLENGY